jgi:type IV pilus assembly protein PilA
MKIKRGFTLVELLAVIAILAILIIIALPNILKLFNEAQIKVFLQEAQNINKAAENGYLAQKMGTSNPIETIYTYTDGEESSTGNIKVSITGKKPKNGELIIMPNGQTALAFHNGKYCAKKVLGSNEITVTKETVDECIVDSNAEWYTRCASSSKI